MFLLLKFVNIHAKFLKKII